MKAAMKRILTMLLTIALLATLMPETLPAEVGAALTALAEAAGENRPLPVRDFTPAQAENARAIETLLANATGAEAREGDYSYRLLSDGTAAVTGYAGGGTAEIPRRLGGADVVALAERAFGPSARALTIHGGVLYIAPNAIARGASISAWQGSYAATYAQQNGHVLTSKTEGVLYDGVVDMTDALDDISLLSETRVSMRATDARRLSVGDSFVLNRGNSDELFYTVASKRQIGAKAYLTVKRADITAIYSYRLYEGEASVTKTFTDTEETGVDLEAGEVEAASLVYEKPAYTEKHTPDTKSVTAPLPDHCELTVTYKQTTTLTSAYRVVVENGNVISGTMATEQNDTKSFEVKFKKKGKIASLDGDLNGVGMSQADREKAINFLLKMVKGTPKKPAEKLGSFTLYVVPAIGLGFEFTAGVGWEAGGSGKASWQERTLTTYEYVPSKDDWGFKDSMSLPVPDPDVQGTVFFKVSASVGMNLVSFWVTSELHTKAEAALKVDLSVSTEPKVCNTFKISWVGTVTVEVGLWFSLLKWEVQLASAKKWTLTLWDIPIVDLHISPDQGLHWASKCAYEPMDYCLRFVTGTGWQPASVCYLKSGSYSYSPFNCKFFTFEADGALGKTDPNTALEVKHVTFDYNSHKDALDHKLTLPQMNLLNDAVSGTLYDAHKADFVRWRVVEPASYGDYVWDEDKTVKANIEAILGKSITSQDDLPTVITLEADWSNKHHISFDANGGSFPNGTAVGGVLTKYYAPGEVATEPAERPTITLGKFDKWTTDLAGQHPWTPGQPVTEDLHLYAQYESFDPTDHNSVNRRYGSTPTLIGDAVESHTEEIAWYLKLGNHTPDEDLLDAILKDGVAAFEASAAGQLAIAQYGPISCTPQLRNCKGSVVTVKGEEIGVSLTGLVDETEEYPIAFTVPSTLNGLPVGAERGMMQKLRAETVIFCPTPDGDIAIAEADDYLFEGNPYVKHVYMDATSIVKLGRGAFRNCANLEGVSLPGTMQEIGSEAFKGCSKLDKAVLGRQVDTVGTDAFADCASLTSVTVDTPFLNKMENAFRDSDSNVPAHIDLTLDTHVMVLPLSAFSGCTALKTLLVKPGGRLSEIGFGAFESCSGLETIELNEGLESIDGAAFKGTAITEVSIPSTVSYFYGAPGSTNSFTTSYHPFYGDRIKKITIGGALTAVNYNTFSNAYRDKLEEIVLREGVTEIGNYTFQFGDSSDTALKTVKLPGTLQSIGDKAFENCRNLEKVGVDPEHQAASVAIPGGVSVIPSYAFHNCKKLTSVKMTKSVKSIGWSAFEGCSALTDPGLVNGLETIYGAAFKGTAITEVSIPSTVSYFYGAPGSTNNVRTSDHPFYGDRIKKITIGGALTAVDYNTFSNAYRDKLEEVVLREGVTEIGNYTFQFGDSSDTALKTVKLPSTLQTIRDKAFENCRRLEKVYTGTGLSEIAYNAFNNAHPIFCRLPGTAPNPWLSDWCAANGFTYEPDAVMRVVINLDDGLDEGEVAGASVVEADANGLLEAPDAPTREGWVFLGWYAPGSDVPWNFATDRVGMSDLTLTARWMKESVNGLYRVEDEHAVLVSYALADGENTVVALPPAWRGYPVTAIADGAFDGEPVTGITLPASVAGVTAATFAGADSLSWIDTPANCENYASREGVLYTADGTALVYCPAARWTAGFTVPDGVTAIGAGAFEGHDELAELTFDEALTEIGDGAFRDCDGLTALALPDGVTRIGANAFRGCSGLRTVSGAANCVQIGGSAFASTGFCIFYGAEDSALVQYAVANERPYNIYTVSYVVDGEAEATRRVQAGSAVPDVRAEAGEGRMAPETWYADADLSQTWDFNTMTMPMADLTLYASTLPRFVTEAYEPEVQEGEEAPEAGLRVVGYNGGAAEITVPDSIDGATVYVVDASAFPTGCDLVLPSNLLEIDVEAFEQRNIALYAQTGSATEALLLAADYELNKRTWTLAFESNGGTLVQSMRVQADAEVDLPESVRDGCELIGWYSDETLTTLVGAAGESYAMPDGDSTLYASWSGEAPEYVFLWEQRGETVAVTGSVGAAAVEIPATINGLPVTRIDESAFAGDTALTDVALPESLEAIGAYAFFGSGLAEAALPETVESVGRYAFASCASLERFAWASGTAAVSEGALCGNAALTELTLPEGVTSLGANALEGCSALRTLALPDSLTAIGSGALRHMDSLATLTLGANATTIASDALDGCGALMDIEVAPGNANYESVNGVLYYAGRAGVVKYPAGRSDESFAVDAAAEIIEARAFAGAAKLKQVTLPAGIAQIGAEAFASSGITDIDLAGLTELEEISEGAFSGCDALEELDIPDAVTEIGDDAFSAATTLVVGAGSAAESYALAWGLDYRLRDAVRVPAEAILSNKASLTLMLGIGYALEAQVLPADTTDALVWSSADTGILRVDNGYIRPLALGETEILAMAGEAELAIPVRVVDSAIAISPESGVVFSDSPLRLSVRDDVTDNAGGVTGAAWSCEDAEIDPSGLLRATETGIATVRATASDGSVAQAQFACLVKDGVLSLPSAIRQIEEEAFRGSDALTSVVVPEGAESIGAYAFADCPALGMVYIPSSATEVSATAFDNSPNVLVVCRAGSAAEAAATASGVACFTVP